jgi:hypothetical protein
VAEENERSIMSFVAGEFSLLLVAIPPGQDQFVSTFSISISENLDMYAAAVR